MCALPVLVPALPHMTITGMSLLSFSVAAQHCQILNVSLLPACNCLEYKQIPLPEHIVCCDEPMLSIQADAFVRTPRVV